MPLRTMIALLDLKHTFNESDEGVVERLADSPNFQFFSGQAYFEPRQPCDATTLVKFRQLLGEDGVEQLLAQTVEVAVQMKRIKPQELARVSVDSTVEEKAIAHPTVSRLLKTARAKLKEAPKNDCIDLKQTNAQGSPRSQPQGRALCTFPQDCGVKSATAFVDLGYRGVDAENPGVRIVHRGKAKRITAQERKQLKRRQAIEPFIGHLRTITA